MKPLLLTITLLFSTPAWAEVIYDGTIQISFLKHCSTGIFIRPKENTRKSNPACFKKFDKKNNTVVTHLTSYKFYDDDEFAYIVNLIEGDHKKALELQKLAIIKREKEATQNAAEEKERLAREEMKQAKEKAEASDSRLGIVQEGEVDGKGIICNVNLGSEPIGFFFNESKAYKYSLRDIEPKYGDKYTTELDAIRWPDHKLNRKTLVLKNYWRIGNNPTRITEYQCELSSLEGIKSKIEEFTKRERVGNQL